jgi:hypothetical protein
MPRRAKYEILEDRMISETERLAFSPDTCATAKARYMQVLSSLLRRRSKRQSEKQAAARARRAERDEAERSSRYVSHLPDNGRMIRD